MWQKGQIMHINVMLAGTNMCMDMTSALQMYPEE